MKNEDTGKIGIIYNFLYENRLSLHNWSGEPGFAIETPIDRRTYVEVQA